MDKIVVPTKETKRIKNLESENADLWYENIIMKQGLDETKQEVADLWFISLSGGVK